LVGPRLDFVDRAVAGSVVGDDYLQPPAVTGEGQQRIDQRPNISGFVPGGHDHRYAEVIYGYRRGLAQDRVAAPWPALVELRLSLQRTT